MRHELIERAGIVALVPIAVLLACAPLLGAGFHTEDFTWLALARQLDAPWELLYKNVVFAYFYRPVGLLFWRFSAEIAGTDPALHNLLDLLLQAFDAMLIALLGARLSGQRSVGLVAGLSFACLPAASATALWMSDRFDPLSLCFGLLALLAFDRALRTAHRTLWTAALCLLLCLTAKEIGFAIAASMLALLAWDALARRAWRPWAFAAVLVPVAAALALHAWVVASVDAALDSSQSLLALWRGVRDWWLRFPAAVFGFHEPADWAWIVLAGTSLFAIAGIAVAFGQRRHDVSRLALVGAAMVVVPAFLQWPVTQLVLGSDAALAFTTNLRFYYVAIAGLALLAGAGYAGLRASRMRWLLLAGICALGIKGFVTANDIARSWASDTRAYSASYVALGQDLGARSFSPGCVIRLNAPGFPADFAHFADVIVKGTAPRGANVLGCAVFANDAPYLSIVGADLCVESAWPGLTIRQVQGRRLLASMGNLCMLSFDPPQFVEGDRRLRVFDVSATGQAQEVTR